MDLEPEYSDAALNEITECVIALDVKTQELADLDLKWKAKKEEIRNLKENVIPSTLQEAGLKGVVMKDGRKVSYKEDVYASILKGDRDRAFAWLDENNFAGLIKTKVIIEFGREEKQEAIEFMTANDHLDPSLKEDIHAQTLKAFLREQLAEGVDIPLDLFGARTLFTTTIKKTIY